MCDQSFCLKWDGHHSSVTSLLSELRDLDELLDVTLCCNDFSVRAHRLLLSACSPFLRRVLKNNPCKDMVFYMKDTAASDLRAIVEFIYKGSVKVSQNQLPSFIKLADSLQIRGLSGDDDKVISPGSLSPSAPASRASVCSPVAPTDGTSLSTPGPRSRQESVAPAAKRRRDNHDQEPAQPTPPPPPPRHSPTPPAAATEHQSQPSPGQLPLEQGDSGHTDSFSFGGERSEQCLKVEKVDLTEMSDDADGDETELSLGRLADYEAVGELSEASLMSSGLPASLLSAGGGGTASLTAASSLYQEGVPGSSHILADDSMTQAVPRWFCPVCERSYTSRNVLARHMKMHEGKTRCPVCGAISSMVHHLRRHMRKIHGCSREEIDHLLSQENTANSDLTAAFSDTNARS